MEAVLGSISPVYPSGEIGGSVVAASNLVGRCLVVVAGQVVDVDE